MATFAIGDIQGCYSALRRLLEHISFDPPHDRLWLSGDLVNRGPGSLEVLRYIRSLGDSALMVLGNHDLHLLATVAAQRNRTTDTFAAVLEASDRDELLNWLRRRPLTHDDPELGILMVHAGLPPQWTIETAQQLAREVETVLCGDEHESFLKQMYADSPTQWHRSLTGTERLRYVVNALTRIRYCYPDGRLDFSNKGPPGEDTSGLTPWFEMDRPEWGGKRVLFGHWSSLGLIDRAGVIGLDTGCVWGRQLTAVQLTAPVGVYQVNCEDCATRS